MKLDNKGQVLILFVLLLPLMIMALALVTDLGFLLIETTKVKNNIKEVIEYGLDSNSLDKEIIMNDMLSINLDEDDIYSVVIDDNITVKVDGSYDSVFKSIFKKQSHKYSYTYKGYKEDNKNIIVKEG